ncbi:MAG: hypothetical protein M1829_003060 [Trizodia sp. TS-e1964]|nr:MAG: hypothetical protein M1829_003060 [Trizodia sp. TS-e1964]
MSAPTDIITYIGVPLAVLGVLPIIYTSTKALLAVSSIKHELRRNGLAATVRGSLMSRTVEIELPRLSITPLERCDPRYWQLSPAPSQIRGGSWTLFHWEQLVTGHSLYRLQYRDEIRQPQAEVDFEELVAFLLDRGAVPSAEGWHMLKTSGLWTPTGTELLLSPDLKHSVLKVAPTDDSDGNLSLRLKWLPTWDLRDSTSLPPYWMRLGGAIALAEMKPDEPEKEPEPNKDEKEEEGEEKAGDAALVELDVAAVEQEKAAEVRVTEIKASPQSIRFRIASNGLQEAYLETRAGSIESKLNIEHLRFFNDHHGPPGLWFAVTATALGNNGEEGGMGLWSYTIPEPILTFAKKDTIPCGVMVILGVIDEADTPEWATTYDQHAEVRERHQAFVDQQRKINIENRLPPAQRDAARMARLSEERANFHSKMLAPMKARQEREEKRLTEALNSPRLSNDVVARANLAWLKAHNRVPSEASMQKVVDSVLHTMILQEPAWATRLCDLLDQWHSWSGSGGMNRVHLAAVREGQELFALASCIVCLIRDASVAGGNNAADLQDSIRRWNTVRIG